MITVLPPREPRWDEELERLAKGLEALRNEPLDIYTIQARASILAKMQERLQKGRTESDSGVRYGAKATTVLQVQ